MQENPFYLIFPASHRRLIVQLFERSQIEASNEKLLSQGSALDQHQHKKTQKLEQHYPDEPCVVKIIFRPNYIVFENNYSHKLFLSMPSSQLRIK